jgi:hypothetical protein
MLNADERILLVAVQSRTRPGGSLFTPIEILTRTCCYRCTYNCGNNKYKGDMYFVFVYLFGCLLLLFYSSSTKINLSYYTKMLTSSRLIVLQQGPIFCLSDLH